MTIDKIKEGDICVLDESVEYSYKPHKPYEVLVLWHGFNCQPLVTKVNEYKPFWTTYSQLIEIKGHIELHTAIASLEAWEAVRQEIDESRDTLKTMIDGEWFAGKLKGLDCAVAIINKHLQEIKNG